MAGVKKYIFIDSNIYYGLFSDSEDYSDDILKLIEKLVSKAGIVLLLPQQVKDEVTRDRMTKWWPASHSTLVSKLTSLDKKIEKLDLDYKNYSAAKKLGSEIEREKGKINKKINSIKKQYLSTRSRSNVRLKKLFKIAQIVEEDPEIIQNAIFRREKGNPPNDSNKLGDKIIWESLLAYLEKVKSTRPLLIFVAKDPTAWKAETSGGLELNLWLHNEYGERTGGKVVLIDNLSKIPGLTPGEQRVIEEKEKEEHDRSITEKLKTIIPERFRTSNTFDDSDRLMKIVEPKLGLIDEVGIAEILKASIDNVNNSLGPYNQILSASHAPVFFQNLLAAAIFLGSDMDIWVDFYLGLDESDQVRFIEVRKMLEQKGMFFDSLDPISSFDPNDIPF